MLAKTFSSSRWRLLAAAALAGVLVLTGLSLWVGILNRGESYVQDFLMKATASETDPELILLGLDEESLTLNAVEPSEIAESRALQLMAEGYPWSREVYALAIDRLMEAGARVVIFDLAFPTPRQGDDVLAKTLQAAGPKVILGSNFDLRDTYPQLSIVFVPPTPQLAEAADGHVGFVTLPTAADGVVRFFYPYATIESFQGNYFGEDPPLPALSTAAARTLGFALPIPSSPQSLRFRYLRKESLQATSFYEIFVPELWRQNFADGRRLEGKTVLIGATAQVLQDFHPTPMGRMSGPAIHLNILSAIHRQAWVHAVPYGLTLLSIPLTGLLVLLLALRRRSVVVFLASLGGFVLLAMGAFLFSYLLTGWYLPLVHPVATILLCGLAVMAADVFVERRERGRLRGTLERYVSKDVVREIVENPASYLHMLGGQRKEVTVLFCDLKGFTTAAEDLEATFMVNLLNEYFGEMVKAIFARRGEVNKFIGDALMAIWGGVQISNPTEDARQAVAAALDMKERRLALNARRTKEGRPAWGAGIGITQGMVVFGNVGAQERMEPAVIGDTVNLASRIESLTRIYGCDILIDERVAAQVKDTYALLLVDIVRVKGRRAHDTLFFPYEKADHAWSEEFTKARLDYLAGRFSEALARFTVLATTGPAPGLAQCYLHRCETFLQRPPHEGWDGIWDFAEK